MESTFCLSCCSPPSMSLNLSATKNVKLTPAAKLRSGHSSLSFSSSTGVKFTRGPLGHVFNNPVICAVDRSSMPSKNETGESKIVKGAVGASLLLSCALGIMCCSSKMNPKAIAGPKEMYQKVPTMSPLTNTIGGSLALKSFLDVGHELASSLSRKTPEDIKTLPAIPSMEEINAVKMEAVRTMKAGKPEQAAQRLRDLYSRYREDPEPAYHIEMALVEILIYLGKYEEALNCNCLKEEHRLPSDDRYTLYKAIIHTQLNHDEARHWWEQFAATIEGFDPRNS